METVWKINTEKTHKIDEMPQISVVMPAYNAEKYISKAIDSVIEQSYKNWELVIVDDCSTDNTAEKVKRYNDDRIVFLSRKNNSGSAYVPRMEAVYKARGEWIVNLDADDYLDKDNLKILIEKAERENLDICTPRMIVVDENEKETGAAVHSYDFDCSRIYSGKEAFSLTLPVWKIGMNGALVKKDIWEKALDAYKKEGKREIHDDENISRIMIADADRFAASTAKYYYRVNPMSVTGNFSINSFGWMKSNEELKAFIIDKFGKDSKEEKTMELYDYISYGNILSAFLKSNLNDINPVNEGLYLSKLWHDKINWKEVLDSKIDKKSYILKNFWLSVPVLALKNRNLIFITFFIKKIFSKIVYKLSSNKYCAWFITRIQREKKYKKQLENYYNGTEDNADNAVYCVYEGAIPSGGLADRLKGIIGVYSVAKKKGIPFKLYFKDPFPLEDFFVPNKYDWTSDKVCRNKDKVDIIVLDNTQDSRYQIDKQKKYLEKNIIKTEKQTHVYTNASFSYDLNYAELFGELFKPSDRLQAEINRQKDIIGAGYISISCRFLDLLGDFNETFGYGEALPESEKKHLLNMIDEVVQKLHTDNPGKKILINSDSVTFLDKYKNTDFAYVIEGNVTHIDAQQSEYSYEKYEKTFLDFMMIANADEIYLIKSSKMHKSGYPFAASKIYNKPFEIINI